MAEGADAANAPTEPQRPESYGQWQKVTATTMTRARFQASDMLTRLQNYEAAESLAKAATAELTKRERDAVKKSAKKRVKAHEEVINHSQKCIKEIEDAMCQLEATLTALTHQRYARFADMQVCQRRIEIRDKRPVAEAFRDQLSHNLDREKAVLNISRKELLERETEVKRYLVELGQQRAELSHDTGSRRLQVEHEYANLKPVFAPPLKASSPRGEGEESPPPSPVTSPSGNHAPTPVARAPSAKAAAAPAPAPAEEEAPAAPADAWAHVKRTAELLGNVDEFRERSAGAIGRSARSGRVATAEVTRSLAKRTIELAAVKKTLEAHIGDVEYAIEKAEQSVDKQEKRLDPRDGAKKAKLQQTKDLLESMKKTRRELIEDLRCKIAALDLDNSCRRVTPQVASEKRPSSSSRTKKKPQNSSSLPNLHGIASASSTVGGDLQSPGSGGFRGSATDGQLGGSIRPSSPPGLSKTLKAAGAAATAG